jgi:peroxiredoxin
MRGGAIAVALLAALLAAPELPAATAPRFRITTLDGTRLDLETLRRRGPVLIDFWATWCKPCLESIPEIEALHWRYGPRGLTVVGISVDGPRNYSKVRPFVARLGITYPVALDPDGRLQADFQVRAMPTTVLVDTSGAVVRVMQGFRPGEGEVLAAALEKLLPAPADSAAADSAGAAR